MEELDSWQDLEEEGRMVFSPSSLMKLKTIWHKLNPTFKLEVPSEDPNFIKFCEAKRVWLTSAQLKSFKEEDFFNCKN